MFNSSFNATPEVKVPFYCMKSLHVGFLLGIYAVLPCFFLGTPAHFYFLWLSVCDICKIKATQVLPLNIRLMELLLCIIMCIDFLNLLIFRDNGLQILVHLIFALSWIGRLLIQVCVCVEQYLAVIYPVMFLRYKSIQYRVAVAVALWLLAIAYGFCVAFSLLIFPDYVFVYTCLGGVIIISLCYVSVLRALKHPGPQENTKEKSKDVRNLQKRNAIKTISSGLLTIVLSYSPLIAIPVLKLIVKDQNLIRCEISAPMLSLNFYSVLLPPLWKLYKKGHLKWCRKKDNE